LNGVFFVAKGPNTSEEIPEDVNVGESNEKSPMDDLIEVTDESEIQCKSKGGTYIHIILDLTGNDAKNATIGHHKHYIHLSTLHQHRTL
jgi:hypothetical protein